MPKVIEVLVKKEVQGQIWTEVVPLDQAKERGLLPVHLEKGVRASPSQLDSFPHRERES